MEPSSEMSNPPLPLAYASVNDFAMIRPLLWLIVAIQVGLVVSDLSRAVFAIVSLLFSGLPATVLTIQWSFYVAIAIRIGLAAWVGFAARDALHRQRLGLLQMACGFYTVASLVIGLSLTLFTAFAVRNSTSMPAYYSVQYIFANIVGQLAAAIVPAATWWIVGRVRRQWPNWR